MGYKSLTVTHIFPHVLDRESFEKEKIGSCLVLIKARRYTCLYPYIFTHGIEFSNTVYTVFTLRSLQVRAESFTRLSLSLTHKHLHLPPFTLRMGQQPVRSTVADVSSIEGQRLQSTLMQTRIWLIKRKPAVQ